MLGLETSEIYALGTLSGTFHSFSMEQTLGTVVTVHTVVSGKSIVHGQRAAGV
jgi:hypothetical protein